MTNMKNKNGRVTGRILVDLRLLMKLVWLLFPVLVLASCASNQYRVSSSRIQPMPTPGPIVSASGQVLAPAGVIKQSKPQVITTLCNGDKKTVELDAQRTEFDYGDPSKSKLIFINTKPAEAYLTYPGASTFRGERSSTTFTSASFTIYPTKDPTCGRANGTFEWAITGFDWNKPGETQQVGIQDRNFNPGTTVLFGDSNYAYPLIPGYVVQGKGVRFVIQTPASPSGVELLPGTTIAPAK